MRRTPDNSGACPRQIADRQTRSMEQQQSASVPLRDLSHPILRLQASRNRSSTGQLRTVASTPESDSSDFSWDEVDPDKEEFFAPDRMFQLCAVGSHPAPANQCR